MTDVEYAKMQEYAWVSGAMMPQNQIAIELTEQAVEGEVFTFKEITARDVSFHRCYFSLINYIWSWMPKKFKEKVVEAKFYMWLKHLKGEYEVLFEFKDGTKLVEYESISFSKMSQPGFETYIREQLPWIYKNVVGQYYHNETYNDVLEDIEREYKRFLNRL